MRGVGERFRGVSGPVLAGTAAGAGMATLTVLIARGLVAPLSMFSLEVGLMLVVVGWFGALRPVFGAEET